jgi:rSAM/selenodomain-associated transferase 1
MPFTDILMVVAKKPAPGQTKTRLCPPFTDAQAARLYECFLRDTLDTMRQVPGVHTRIGFLPEDAQDYFDELAPDMSKEVQVGDTLGERLDHLLTHALSHGTHKAVVIDSDSPTLPVDYLIAAFERLEAVDVVLGPTQDGGYYLIGLKQPTPQLLRTVQMSTPHVLADTLAVAKRLQLKVDLLPVWYDIDTIDDLYQLDQEITAMNMNGRAASTRRWLASVSWRHGSG